VRGGAATCPFSVFTSLSRRVRNPGHWRGTSSAANATRFLAPTLRTGVNPTYVSKRMGHTRANMLFTVYATGIDGVDRGRESAKLVGLLGPDSQHKKKKGRK